MNRLIGILLAGAALVAQADVEISNAHLALALGDDARVKSLVDRVTGEELLDGSDPLSFVTITLERPFNNEMKLAYPNQRTTCRANRVRRAGDRLVFGFEKAGYEAEFSVKATDAYVAFRFERFIGAEQFYGLNTKMDVPPVSEICLAQLPVRRRAHFGEWLNVMWDGKTSLALIAASPDELVAHEPHAFGEVMSLNADSRVRLEGTTALLVVAPTARFLDCIDAAEVDYGMPRGVRSRREQAVRGSTLSCPMTPKDVDEQIAMAKRGGFENVQLRYSSMVKEGPTWELIGNYDWKDEFPNGEKDLRAMLAKVKAAGLRPGLHFLQTHIGLRSRYATPVADPRLGKTRRFTLAAPLADDATEMAVEENPLYAPKFPNLRVLQFGGELIRYAGRRTTRPYAFTGLERGAFGTRRTACAAGTVGGVLHICEYGGTNNVGSCYLDLDTSLADEIADKIAALYNCGFEFVYMDGSEGAKAPFGHYVAAAQKRVWDRLRPAPRFAKAAAKAHFSWHMLSGANAYDQFSPEDFKSQTVKHPVAGAVAMRDNFTQVDFGWWGIWYPEHHPVGTMHQQDMWEFGLKLATAYDCPVTVQLAPYAQLREKCARLGDMLDTFRRWQDARRKGFFTEAMRRELADASVEHHLIENPDGSFELVAWRALKTPDPNLSAWYYTRRDGASFVRYWHCLASASYDLKFADGETVRWTAGDAQDWRTSRTVCEIEAALAAGK